MNKSKPFPPFLSIAIIPILMSCTLTWSTSSALVFAQETLTRAQKGKTLSQITPGDSLKIMVYREPDLSGEFLIDDNGFIQYPLVGSLNVSEKHSEEIAAEISDALKKYIIDPQVTVSHQRKEAKMGDILKNITLIGETRRPGTYDVVPHLTLTQIIAEAGGFTPVADTQRIKIIRVENGVQKVYLYSVDAIHNAEIIDPLLEAGDKIIVPVEVKDVNSVAILGEVRKAGMYEVTKGITLMRLIAKAGGFTPLAATSKVRIVREENGRKNVYVYNAGDIISGLAEDPALKPGDMIFIPETFF